MRAVVLVLDSVGIGGAPDAARFGDAGADTLGHIAERCAAGQAEAGRSGPLRLPNLEALGFGAAHRLATGAVPMGFDPTLIPAGAFAAAQEVSTGKDTSSGHWELAGVPVEFDWGYFTEKENSFPRDLLDRIVARAGLPGCLGNCHASGTTIIAQLGEEHIRSGKPIFYTSADSVFQIAAHEESFGLDRLYDLCRIAFEEVQPYRICRVIARPFVGRGGGSDGASFKRTGNRHDYSVPPPAPTVLKHLTKQGGEVIGIGKIGDIYAGDGIGKSIRASGHEALWQATCAALGEAGGRSLVMTNFVNFDQDYGHRRDVAGYARALEEFDRNLPALQARLRPDDLLVITADHGNDPTWTGTDHTRERIPLLLSGARVPPGSRGVRSSFADLGQTLAHWFELPPMPVGTAIL